MNDPIEQIISQKKMGYDTWKTMRSVEEKTSSIIELPQSNFDLLYAIENKQLDTLFELSNLVWDRVMLRLWHTSITDFLDRVTIHMVHLLENCSNIIERIWSTLGLAIGKTKSYEDSILDEMFSWVEDILPKGIEKNIPTVYRVFVRDFLLEIAMVEGIKYEMDVPNSNQSCLNLFNGFVDNKIRHQLERHLSVQHWDDTKAEIKAGLMGYGSATLLWTGRKTIRQFDRALSSLAPFIIKTTGYIINDLISDKYYYRINSDTITGLWKVLPAEFLKNFVLPDSKIWQTRGGALKALEKANPLLVTTENKPYFDNIIDQIKVRKEFGVRSDEEEDNPIDIENIPDIKGSISDVSLEVLCNQLLDIDRFEALLDGWEQLSSKERHKLYDKFIFLKILVMSEAIDDLFGAYSARDGSVQLKCLLSQGISKLVFGVVGGNTPHRWINSDEDDRDKITSLGFIDKSITEVMMDLNKEANWDLWRLVYTISFISALCRVDDLFQKKLKEKNNIFITPEGECRISLSKLLSCLLKKNKEEKPDEDSIKKSIYVYNKCLRQCLHSVETSHHDESNLSVHLENEGIVARVAYPHILLGGYAPNAFITLYWNLHQGKNLGIESMRGKRSDLGDSLISLRRLIS